MQMTYGLNKIILSIAFCGLFYFVKGQGANYSFDDCTFVDHTGAYDAAETIFPPSCDCGLSGQGLYFDGNDDHLIFPTEIDSLMTQDFTISFYFRFDEVTTRTDLLSVRSECALDSFLAVTYNPVSNQIAYELAQDIGNIQTENVALDNSVCWHRIVLTKSELFYSLYLDDELAVTILSEGTVNFDRATRLTLTNSPCLAVNLDRFNGWIDEFIFYDRALSAIEIVNSSLTPDMVVSNDTTIVAGSPVDIITGATCAGGFAWSPITGLDDAGVLDPVATPDQTTTYTITYANDGNCTTSDSMTINVIDPNALDCSALLLPNVFTPNNDQLNDRYGISTLFLIDDLVYFEIYDRWGGKIWEARDKSALWDGSFKGQTVNPGMYIYKVKYSCGGQEYVKVDNFSVLR